MGIRELHVLHIEISVSSKASRFLVGLPGWADICHLTAPSPQPSFGEQSPAAKNFRPRVDRLTS